MTSNDSVQKPIEQLKEAAGVSLIIALAGAAFLGIIGLVVGYGYTMKWFAALSAPFGILIGLWNVYRTGPEKANSVYLLAALTLLCYCALIPLAGNGFLYVVVTIVLLVLAKRLFHECRYNLIRGFFSGVFSGLIFGILFGYFALSSLAMLLLTSLFGVAVWFLQYFVLRFKAVEKMLSLVPHPEDNSSSQEKGSGQKVLKAVRENVVVVMSAIVIAALIRIFVVDNYEIPSGSMIPNLLEGDRLFVTKFVYGARIPVLPNWKLPPFAKPKRSDIVVFQAPKYTSPGAITELVELFTFGVFRLDPTPKNFVKRLIGMPGDRIRLDRGGVLYINGKRIKRKFYQRRTVVSYGMAGGKTKTNIYVNNKLIYSYVFRPLESSMHIPAGTVRKENYVLYREAGRIVQYLENEPGSFRPFPREYRSASEFEGFRDLLSSYMFRNDNIPIVVSLKNMNRAQYKNMNLLVFNEKGNAWYRRAGEKKLRPLLERKRDGRLWIVVPEDHYFMMGDNRDRSSDCRDWGFVHKGYVMGTPLIRYWPFGRFGKVK